MLCSLVIISLVHVVMVILSHVIFLASGQRFARGVTSVNNVVCVGKSLVHMFTTRRASPAASKVSL